MKQITLNNVPFERERAHNSGQHAERVFYYHVHGIDGYSLDNVSHTVRGDVLNMQVKTARATVCRGTDFNAYIAMEAAEQFVYVTKDCKYAVIMSRAEWVEFVGVFGYKDVASDKVTPIIRLKHESGHMLGYLGLSAHYTYQTAYGKR